MPKRDDSRIDTIGRAIARPQQYSGAFRDLLFDKFYDVFGLPGFIVVWTALGCVSLYTAYQLIIVEGGILGWILGLFVVFYAVFFFTLSYSATIFWRLDDGESTSVLGIRFRN